MTIAIKAAPPTPSYQEGYHFASPAYDAGEAACATARIISGYHRSLLSGTVSLDIQGVDNPLQLVREAEATAWYTWDRVVMARTAVARRSTTDTEAAADNGPAIVDHPTLNAQMFDLDAEDEPSDFELHFRPPCPNEEQIEQSCRDANIHDSWRLRNERTFTPHELLVLCHALLYRLRSARDSSEYYEAVRIGRSYHLFAPSRAVPDASAVSMPPEQLSPHSA